MFRDLHPIVRTRIWISFLSRIGSSMVFPFMAIYFSAHFGAATAGLLMAVQIAVQFFCNLYGGFLADTWGRRTTLLVGEGLRVVAFLGLVGFNLQQQHPWGTFSALLLASVAWGLINPSAEAMLVDVSTRETRARMYTISYWALNLSVLLGTVVGGWLYQQHFSLLLLVLLGIAVITLLMTFFMLQETFQPRPVDRASYGLQALSNSYRTVVQDRAFMLFTAAGIAILSLEFQRINFIGVHLAENFPARVWFGQTLDGVKMLSLLSVLNVLLVIVLANPIARWISRIGPLRPMHIGALVFALGLAPLAFSVQLPVLLTATVVFTLGELVFVPARQTLLAEMVDAQRRGAYMAINGQTFQFAEWVGALTLTLGHYISGPGMAVLYLLLAGAGILLAQQAVQLHKQNGVFAPSASEAVK